MIRTYSNLTTDNIKSLLDVLVNRNSVPDTYKDAMTKIGMSLGDAVLSKIDNNQDSIYLACTVEDADYLAKGMLSRLEQRLRSVAFACFWNERFSPFDIDDLQIAPIIKKYQEPTSKTVNYLIVVKSIISGACVVKTNLTYLIQRINPEKIFIVAPVMYYQAEQKLKNEFDNSIYDKFQFFYFAKDNQRTSEGEVIPGIGGMIYDRLGSLGQEDKNRYVPEIVKSRRSKIATRLSTD